MNCAAANPGADAGMYDASEQYKLSTLTVGFSFSPYFSPGPVLHDRGHGRLEEPGEEVDNMVDELTDHIAMEVVVLQLKLI